MSFSIEEEETKVINKQQAEEKKNEGNEALKAGKLSEAVTLYSEAIGKCRIYCH